MSLLIHGTVLFAQVPNTDVLRIDSRQNLGVIWDGNALEYVDWGLLRSSDNTTAGLEFLKFTTSTVQLIKLAEFGYAPARQSAAKLVSATYAARLPSSHLDKGVIVNTEFGGTHYLRLSKAFER